MISTSGFGRRLGRQVAIGSRRDVITAIGAVTVGGAMALITPACARAAQIAGEDDDAYVQRLLGEASAHLPYRADPYRLRRTVRIPAGRTLSVEPGTRIVWAGATGDAQTLIGVFEAAGDDTGIVVSGGEAFIECLSPSPFVYAAFMRGYRGFVVTGIQARECGHVHVGPTTSDYVQIRLDGDKANAPRDVRIEGGGASYAKRQPFGHGACFLAYLSGGHVRDAHYANVANGVQWWGGNADPVRPPAQGGSANPRKCRNILIEGVSVDHVSGAAIWGSMGSNITVRECTISDIGDVGFDAEGCNQVTFERCTARNARNGCFATFFLCNGIRFVNCTGIVDDKAFPLIRVYNESQTNWDNTGLEVLGGSFECRDHSGPGTIDTAMGPVGTLKISNAALKNVCIDVAHSNMHRTTISRNTLDFPYPLGSLAAITAGSSKSLQKASPVIAGSTVVEYNVIRYTADPGSRDSVAIVLREDDFNSSAADSIRFNRISGPFRTGIVLINASANVGIVPSFAISANRFYGMATARLLWVRREGPNSRPPTIRWDVRQTRNGRSVSLAQALR